MSDIDNEATAIVVEPVAERIDIEDPHAPKVGRWYWLDAEIQDEHYKTNVERVLACVTEIGSNYAELTARRPVRDRDNSDWHPTWRVHLDHFYEQCTLEPAPTQFIAGRIEHHHGEVKQLMSEIKRITAQLAVQPTIALPGVREVADETSATALALRSDKPVEEYKLALIKAKDETLPALFEKIKKQHGEMASWMQAQLIPMRAASNALKPAQGAIEKRLYSVELYAGLVENSAQFADGEPAGIDEPIHLVQRMCFMDEECLAQYDGGGMEYKDINDFDRWLAKPDNRDRLLPFPKTIVAFRVRRNAKERDKSTLSAWFDAVAKERADKKTFLYVRNGERLHWLETSYEFGEKIFPDLDAQKVDVGEMMYARTARHSHDEWEFSTAHQYQGFVEADRELERDLKAKKREFAAKQATLPKKERVRHSFYDPREHRERLSANWTPMTPKDLYYDNMIRARQAEIERHNHLVLIVQGLLDRSPILHPHPKWSLTGGVGDFQRAIRLVYDSSRALVGGEKPDFEAYRARLNMALREGCVTVGQKRRWLKREAKKEAARQGARGHDFYKDYYKPHGDDGPGYMAKVAAVSRDGRMVFRWVRDKARGEGHIGASIKVKPEHLFNVTAYTPGDLKLFFADPRTREEYLEWAPLLMAAEDFYAGKRQAQEPTEGPKPTPRGPGDSWRSRHTARLRELGKWVGSAARFRSDMVTKGGKKYPKGTLVRITYKYRGDSFSVHGITKDGERVETEGEKGYCSMSCIEFSSLEIVPGIPEDPDYKPEEPRKRPKIDDDDDD